MYELSPGFRKDQIPADKSWITAILKVGAIGSNRGDQNPNER
jgi:hypothetical protein